MKKQHRTPRNAARATRLKLLPTLWLSCGFFVQPAGAATYFASNQATLLAAIASANADGDPSSTIYLTALVTISSPAPVLSVTKNLAILPNPSTTFYLLVNGGPLTAAISDGVTLEMGSRLFTNGGAVGARRLIVSGLGTLALSGANTQIKSGIQVDTGHLRMEGGVQMFSSFSDADDGLILTRDNTTLTVTGANTGYSSNGNAIIGSANGVALDVLNGARFNTLTANAELLVSPLTTDHATITVSGANSRINAANTFQASHGQGTIDVLDQALLDVNRDFILGGTLSGASSTGRFDVTVSGAGSRLYTSVSGNYVTALYNGSLSVLDGGVFEQRGNIGTTIAAGDGNQFDVVISGAGSSFLAAGDVTLGTGANATGTVTVADGASFSVGGGTGTLTMTGGSAGSAAELNVGGGVGRAATAAGSVSASVIAFGAGADAVNFNHTEAAYVFNPVITGHGVVNHTGPGTTILTANSDYTGGTFITAGTLQLGNGGATGSIVGNVANDGVLAVNRSDAYTLQPLVTGSGQLHQIGTGTTIIDTAQAYTGGTLISSGTLQIGNGTTVGSIVGDVTNDAILAINRSDNVILGGVISGTGQLRQIGSGTLTLTQANTYTGGTALKTGRIDVSHNQALGTGTLSMDDGTTLGFIANGLNIGNDVFLTGNNDPVIDTGVFDGTLSGSITGAGFLTKQGTGALTLTGANTYTGATNVGQGTLRAGVAGTFSAASAHAVAPGSTLDLSGFNQTIASMNNAGIVSTVGSTAGTTLTVNGPWVGNGGTLRLATVLGDDASVTDRLVLDGATAVASGNTTLEIVNLSGLGAQTTGNGIEVITALNGATTTAQTTRDAFSLAGASIGAGLYDYSLFAGDASGAGENWYLRSTSVRRQGPLFAALPEQLRQSGLAMVGNLHLRMGDETSSSVDGPRAWGRLISSERDISQAGMVSPRSVGRLTGFQAGTDLWASQGWQTGIYVGQLEGDTRVEGDLGTGAGRQAVGSTSLRNQYLGGYATYRHDSGLYADAVMQLARNDYTIKPSGLAASVGKGTSWLASLEGGQSFAISPQWQVEPQLQLVYQRMDMDEVDIPNAIVWQDLDAGWLVRAGVRLTGQLTTPAGVLKPYGRLNFYRSSGGTDVANFTAPGGATTGIVSRMGGSSSALDIGATLSISPATDLYAEFSKLWSSGGNSRTRGGVNASVGVRVRW